jgi:hypothetical protein
MRLSTFINLIANGQSSLMFKLLKTSNEFYRACFVSTAISQGIYDKFVEGKSTLQQLCEKLNIGSNGEGLKAWLELGVSLGELKCVGNEFQIKGKLSKALLKSNNEAYKAFLEEIVKYHYTYIMDSPTMLKKHKLFPFD